MHTMMQRTYAAAHAHADARRAAVEKVTRSCMFVGLVSGAISKGGCVS